jgi:hypothetical protein
LEILVTVVPFVLLWVLMWASLSFTYWLSLLIAVPAAGFLVRLFMIQHDCGHGAFFRSRRANECLSQWDSQTAGSNQTRGSTLLLAANHGLARHYLPAWPPESQAGLDKVVMFFMSGPASDLPGDTVLELMARRVEQVPFDR